MSKKERTLFEIIKKFIWPFLKNKKITIKSLIFYSFWAIWPIAHIYFVQELVLAIENKDKEGFTFIMIIYSWFLFFNYITMYFIKNWSYISNVSFFRKTIHNYYLEKFVKLSNTEVEKLWTWKLISIIWTGIDTWALLLNRVLEHFLKILYALIFTIIMIAIVNIWLSVIFIVLYILMHLIWEYFNNKTLFFRRKRQDKWNEYTGHIVKIIMSKFEILQTWKINRELESVNHFNKWLLKQSLNMASPNYFFFYIPSIFINAVRILMFLYLWYGVMNWEYTMALFVAMFWVLTLMNQTIINSMIFYSELTNDFTKIEKLWDFFDETPDIKWYENWKDFEYKKWDIKLEKINFWYSEKNNIFDNFDLNIKWWKITALVGNSWSWKTTLVKLISWYIKPNSWKIIVDWQSLEKISLKSFYKNIWYLTQEPSVFDWTILDNLTYWSSDNIGKKNIDEAIKKAKCEFIYDLEDWTNTEIWEKGIRLSWGQRQRLAIAKIFLKDPKIIILDEPTSALDSFSEEQITKSLNNLFKWRTVIIIAHRLQTVKNAEEIFVLENWKVIESGNHKKLVEKKWIYKKMLDLQSGF